MPGPKHDPDPVGSGVGAEASLVGSGFGSETNDFGFTTLHRMAVHTQILYINGDRVIIYLHS